MSWAIEVTDEKEAALKKVLEYLDASAANYPGKPEADDIAMVKSRIIANVAAMTFDPHTGVPGADRLSISANGSHSWTDGGELSSSASFKIQRVK